MLAQCYGIECPLKENCCRYRKRIFKKQYDYFTRTPFNEQKNKCEFQVKIRDAALDFLTKQAQELNLGYDEKAQQQLVIEAIRKITGLTSEVDIYAFIESLSKAQRAESQKSTGARK